MGFFDMFKGNKEQEATGDQVIETALNDPGFTEFLSKYPDRIEVSDKNADEVKERYERYQQVESTIKEVQGILADEFSDKVSDDKTKISINPSEIVGARDHLEDLAINDEAEFDQIVEDIKTYKDLQEAALEMEEELQLRVKEFEEKEEELKNSKGLQKIKLQVELNRETKKVNALEKDRDLNEFREVQRSLIKKLGEETGVAELAREKFRKKIEQGIQGDSLDSINRTQDLFNKVTEQYSEFDFAQDTEEFKKEDIAEKLNQLAEERVEKAIKEAIQRTPLGKSTDRNKDQYVRFENALKPYLERERLGTKSQAESKTFVLNTIKDMYLEYTDLKNLQNMEYRSKSWLLQRILEKNGVNLKTLKQESEDIQREREEREAAEAHERRETAKAMGEKNDEADVWENTYEAEEGIEDEMPTAEEEKAFNIDAKDEPENELTENDEEAGMPIPNDPDIEDGFPSIDRTHFREDDEIPNSPEEKRKAGQELSDTLQNYARQKEEQERAQAAAEQQPVNPDNQTAETVEPAQTATLHAEERSDVLSQAEIDELVRQTQPQPEAADTAQAKAAPEPVRANPEDKGDKATLGDGDSLSPETRRAAHEHMETIRAANEQRAVEQAKQQAATETSSGSSQYEAGNSGDPKKKGVDKNNIRQL